MALKRRAVWRVLRHLGRRALRPRPRAAQLGDRATELPAAVERLLLRVWPHLDTPANRVRLTMLRDRIRTAAAER